MSTTTTAPTTATATPTPTPDLNALVYHPTIGIIGHLRTQLWDPNGTTKGEMLVLLTQLFPDRDPYGMSVTVQIQLGRLQRKWGKIVSTKVDGRGRVYGFATHLQVGDYAPTTTATPTPTTPERYPTDEEFIAQAAA